MYEFYLPLRPYSVNAYYYATKKVKTPAAREWETQVAYYLQDHKPLIDMADLHKSRGGTFYVNLCFKYPKHILYNKAGEISSKAMDLSNVEKPLIDQIFGAYMGVNDKYIMDLRSSKRVGASYEISVLIELI